MRLWPILALLGGCPLSVGSASLNEAAQLRGHHDRRKRGKDAELFNFRPNIIELASLKGRPGAISFYMYDLRQFEPRFFDRFQGCHRKGADYMFVDSLRQHPRRTWSWSEAEVIVIPCLFETARRCSSRNTAEKPPSLLQAFALSGRLSRDIPENFEMIPWMKPFDDKTQRCLDMVKESEVYKATGGKRHFFLAADWSMQFGQTLRQEMFQDLSIGRIEAIDLQEANSSNRHFDLEAGCTVVVPFASDVAYSIDWKKRHTFDEWKQRPNLVSFRFENRQYTLFCNHTKCSGAVDATPLREQALELKRVVGERASIFMGRTGIAQYNQELQTSKFCLVIRGDTPSTHAFYDAIAAGCVPVLVSDRWGPLAAPFAHGHAGVMQGGLDFSAFTVRVPELSWMRSAEKVAKRLEAIEEDDDRSRTLHYHMSMATSSLLWSLPKNDVSDNVLAAAWKCARLD